MYVYMYICMYVCCSSQLSDCLGACHDHLLLMVKRQSRQAGKGFVQICSEFGKNVER